jgi:hypothetical protein
MKWRPEKKLSESELTRMKSSFVSLSHQKKINTASTVGQKYYHLFGSHCPDPNGQTGHN